MYREIPKEKGKSACVNGFRMLKADARYDNPLTLEQMKDILKFIQDHSWVEFDGKVYKQWDGTPMGLPHSVALAILFMGELITVFFSEHSERLRALAFFVRFMDDIFGIWDGDEASFKAWITHY